jgi:hypothetical protein
MGSRKGRAIGPAIRILTDGGVRSLSSVALSSGANDSNTAPQECDKATPIYRSHLEWVFS